jgi:hypothetical protein
VPTGAQGRTERRLGHLIGERIGAWTLRTWDLPDPSASGATLVRLDLVRGEVSVTGPLRLARLHVRYRSSEPHAYSVTLTGYGADVRRTLSRFPLATWLAVADTVRRNLGSDEDASLAHRPDRKRPGRAGHSDAFYGYVARRYLELAGDSAPTKALAAEYDVHRNTAAGWVRRAREKGFL